MREWFGPFTADGHYGWTAFTRRRRRAGDRLADRRPRPHAARRRPRLPRPGPRARVLRDERPARLGRGLLPPRPLPDHRGRVAGRRDGRAVRVAGHAFDLGIDGERYRPDRTSSARRRRSSPTRAASTPRRAVPGRARRAGRAAAPPAGRRRLWLFGHGGDAGVDFPHRNLGVVPTRPSCPLYAEATVGLVLSMTNYSLVAQEMLACGLPCVELDAPSVVAAFGRDGAVDFAPLDPVAIADALERLFADPGAARAPRRRGRDAARRAHLGPRRRAGRGRPARRDRVRRCERTT